MKIEKTREIGCCLGVRRAIKLLEKATEKAIRIQTLGPIVNNQPVVNYLAKNGVSAISSLDEFQGGVLATSIRGVTPKILQEIKSRQISLIDATCPVVRRNQRTVKKLADAGFWVVLFGESDNPGGKVLLGWAGNKAMATLQAREVSLINPSPQRLAIISQTTQNQHNFTSFVEEVIHSTLPDVQEVCIVNTLCNVVRRRQEAALELAKRSDLMIVVGGRNSGNTRRLAEACSAVVDTYHIESAAEIRATCLEGKNRVGITAGATTPDWVIEEVILALKLLADQSPSSHPTTKARG